MSRVLSLDPRDPAPLWKQIEDGLRRLVASGALRPGAPLPSVREMSRDLAVNPATVVRAYQRLIDAGFLHVRRGEGTYISESPPSSLSDLKEQELLSGALRYAAVALTVGASRIEAQSALDKALDTLAHHRKETER